MIKIPKYELIEDFGEINIQYKNYVWQKVPDNIVKKGEKAVIEYADKHVDKLDRASNKKQDLIDRIRKNPIKIETTHSDGTKLEGKLIDATSRYVRVRLDKPGAGERQINYSMAAAMGGHYVFDEKGLTQDALYTAERALTLAYQDYLNKPKKDLVDRINKKLKKRDTGIE